jgi:hypothetical protein
MARAFELPAEILVAKVLPFCGRAFADINITKAVLYVTGYAKINSDMSANFYPHGSYLLQCDSFSRCTDSDLLLDGTFFAVCKNSLHSSLSATL